MNATPAVLASRDLRNHTSESLKRAENGESLAVTVNGHPVAMLGPIPTSGRAYLTRAEFLRRFQPADSGLRAQLDEFDQDLDELGGID
ncbi:MAG: type II toxin-antitoxin system prevent-host-death family antitoxin [Mobiluncus porci]|uniref:Type II toxin-antitoxin system prevent-host-death family antitoxin n=1 Tax=Mobiluncus porci TaxID=2652278 RepID=A0A7K0K3U9_9ACTO|nr:MULTISPECIES: type II toxin-antitoxin system prevent-host-death family antitoxin [Mobiluncus]MCI6584520.1 type II toxin-antitoxin system prevent-host-death family antitoxin [Mobiluncus sp.]MDD7542198.1 type II toxin-antitoxin system prevent-host-death family antitoxin [Mobiluncus porci]MDY5748606.1 type II toxin-antitoxin system prevent-host-death family antitoxin [Mobiluncus porci]MST50163.1 type II toxin-antitoxin system prevent-host-death family antitoxin [Mobiluncus porci]